MNLQIAPAVILAARRWRAIVCTFPANFRDVDDHVGTALSSKRTFAKPPRNLFGKRCRRCQHREMLVFM
jgi:hypothetical protein